MEVDQALASQMILMLISKAKILYLLMDYEHSQSSAFFAEEKKYMRFE